MSYDLKSVFDSVEALESVKKDYEFGIKLNIGFIIVSIFLILMAVFVIKDELAKTVIYAIFGFIIFVAVFCFVAIWFVE